MFELLDYIYAQAGALGATGFILGVMFLSSLIYHLIFGILRLRFITTYTKAPPLLRRYLYYPGLSLILLFSSTLAIYYIKEHAASQVLSYVNHAYQILFILTVAALIRRTSAVIREVLISYFDTSKENNLRSRQILTQFKLIDRIISFVVVLFAISFILLTFDSIRQVGLGLLTSAGLIGIVIGFAAQKSIANVVAGIQVAFAQPIRLDDVVIVENEWGKIEEITLTYVTIRIWDERRLIVPLNYFIEKPFQNWTRQSSDLIGTVFIYTDYNVPLDEMRKELDRLLENNPLWDHNVKVLQVTEATEKSIQVRALMSARNAPQAFDLRCEVREGLIVFLQKNYPESLPRTRIEIEKDGRAYLEDKKLNGGMKN
jgi:small-conductance mechanosensitive channel